MKAQPIILWEDALCSVCLKPPNLATIEGKDTSTKSLASWLHSQSTEYESASPSPKEAGLCHRLDTETSGLLIAAKTTDAYDHIRSQFQAGTVEKHYLCLVEGICENAATLNGYLYGRHRRSQKVLVSEKERPRSRPAKLIFDPIHVFPKHSCTLLSTHLLTGFRHQIRTQLAHYGHPLLGDTLYGSTRSLEELPFTYSPFPREQRTFFLDASNLSFQHPTNGEHLSFTSEGELAHDPLFGGEARTYSNFVGHFREL